MRAAAYALVAFLVACHADEVSRTIGARCDTTSECDDRCLEPSTEYPDGFCTVDCTNSADCPTDAECVEKEGGVCLFACSIDRNCAFLGPNWVCRTFDLHGTPTQQVTACIGT